MTRVYYMVGTENYKTRCNTYESALAQARCDSRYTIQTCYERIEEPTIMTEKRAEMLKEKGFIKPKKKF